MKLVQSVTVIMLHIVSLDYTRISSAFFPKDTGGAQQEKYPHKHPVMIKN